MIGTFRIPIASAKTPTIEWTQNYHDAIVADSVYTRPIDWLDITTNYPLVQGNQKFIGLYSVYDTDSNFLRLKFTGNYNVSIYNNSTLLSSTDVLSNVQYNTTLNYSDFDISTLSTLGYKQAIIVVTPQAGQNLLSCNLSLDYNSYWLDIRMAGNYINQIRCYNFKPIALEQFEFVGTNNITNFSSMFNNAHSLKNIKSLYTTSGTNFSSMFYNCYSLKIIPLLDTKNGTNFNSMFNYCISIKSFPLLDTSKGTDYAYMFSYCKSLVTIPLIDTGKHSLYKNNNFTSMFTNCISLVSIPLLDTSFTNNFNSMFNNCTSLLTIPLLDTSKGTTFNSMFYNCTSLVSIPLLNTSNSTDFYYMFNNCTSLVTIPLLDTSKGITFNSFFNNCTSLVSIPLINTSNSTNFSNMFSNCTSLVSIPLINTSKGTFFNSMFEYCTSLVSISLDTSKGNNFYGMFNQCTLLKEVSLSSTSLGNNFGSMFGNCTSIRYLPTLSLNNNSLYGFFDNCSGLSKVDAVNIGGSIDFQYCSFLSKSELEHIFGNLENDSSYTITVKNGYNPFPVGVDSAITKTLCGTTLGSKTITQSDTSSLEVGMLVTGTGINTPRSVTTTVSTGTVNLTTHGLVDGNIISFISISSTTGIVIKTPYYVVSSTIDTFKVSLTLGGIPITLTGSNGTGTINFGTYITAINTNVSFSLDKPASLTGTVTLTNRKLDTSIATLKGWTVTG